MNLGTVFTLLRKELLDFLRDRRTVISLIVVPIALSPLLMLGMTVYLSKTRKANEEKRFVIAFQDSARVGGLSTALTKAGFELKDSDNPRLAVESKSSEIGVQTAQAGGRVDVRIFTDGSRMEMQVARGRIRQALDALKDQRVKAELQRVGVPDTVLTPFKVENVNIAPPRKMGGSILGMFLGYIIVILMISSGMYPAIDMTAGEKERRTLEMLLSTPARRDEIVMGKLLAVMTATTLAALLAIASFGVTLQISRRVGGEADLLGRMGELPIDAATLALIGVAIIPMSILVAAITLAAATPARSTKEAMSYLTPIMTVAIMLAMLSMLPGIDLGVRAALIPVANFSWLLKEVLQGDWSWRNYALTVGANLVYGGLAFWTAVRRFQDEKVLFRS